MDQRYVCLIGCLLFAGCVSVDTKGPFAASRPTMLADMDQVVIGMTHAEVERFVEQEVKIGYQKNAQDQWGIVTLKNPYRSETFGYDGKQYVVEYYVTQIKKADGIIADDELVPLVFENQILKGRGWDDLWRIMEHFVN